MSLFRRGLLSFIIVVLLAGGCLTLPAYFIFENARGLVIRQVSNNAIDIAASISAFVAKDIDSFENSPVYVYSPGVNSSSPEPFLEMPEGPNDATRSVALPKIPGDSSSEAVPDETYINEISALLGKIKTETGAASISITKKVNSDRKGFVSKPDALSSQDLTNDITKEELQVFNEGITSSSDVMNDARHGEYLRGYAPVYDIKNKPVGVVTVEFLLADAVILVANFKKIIIGSFAVIFLLVSFVVHHLLTSRAKYLFTDYLTSLSNKRYYEQKLSRVIQWAEETGQPLSLMMIDIDHFKSINDRMGHAMGDEVLKAVSATLERCTRRGDASCRFGGDEFTMILPRTTAQQAVLIAERIRNQAAALRFEDEDRVFGVTLSIGIAEYEPGMSAHTLTELSDQTLYVSKNGGKNRTSIHGQTANTSAIPALC
jgi:diguanylate cyclase (GGDEF)-like protein